MNSLEQLQLVRERVPVHCTDCVLASVVLLMQVLALVANTRDVLAPSLCTRDVEIKPSW